MERRSMGWSLVAVGFVLAAASSARADDEFVWPASGWITATWKYRWGQTHNGSADIAAPHLTPITAARGGTVVAVTGPECYYVVVSHGNGWTTLYCHLFRIADVKRGQTVRTGQLIGYIGRTGQASNPHCHFAIKRYGVRQVIPGLVYGQWVRRGTSIPGDYAGLGATSMNPFSYPAKTIVDGAELRTSPALGATIAGRLPRGTALTVYEVRSGYCRVRYGGADRWVVQSALEHATSRMFDAQVTVGSLPVRKGPGTGYAGVGTLSSGALVRAYGTQNGWTKILHGYPAYYRWVWGGGTARTTKFRGMVSAESANVRTGPGPQYAVVGQVKLGTGNNIRVFYENRRGWYRLWWDGAWRWVAGWRTAGPGAR